MKRWRIVLAVALAACCGADTPGTLKEAEKRIVSAIQDGDWQVAIKTARYTLKSWPEVSQPERLRIQLLQTEAHIGAQEFDEATILLAPDPPHADEFASVRARHRMLLGDIDRKHGKVESALILYDEAIQLAGIARDRLLVSEIQVRQGQGQDMAGRHEEAEAAFREALQTAQQHGNAYLESLACLNLGYRELRVEHWDESVEWFAKALEAARRAGSRIVEELTHMNLAICYRRLGRFADCRNQCDQLRDLAPVDKSRLAECLGEVANTHVLEGRHSAAQESYMQAINIARGDGHEDQAGRLAGNLATALSMQEKWDEAKRLNALAIDWKIRSGETRGLIFQKLTEARIAHGLRQWQEAESILREILQEDALTSPVRWEATAGLAAVYAARLDWEEANRLYEQALAFIETSTDLLQDNTGRIGFFSVLSGFYRDYVNALLQQGKKLQALRVVESSRARVLAEKAKEAAILQRRADHDYREAAERSKSVLLSYWLGEEGSWLWVVSADGIEVYPLPAESKIADWVESYHRSVVLERRYSTASQLGAMLFSKLVGPGAIPPGSTVYLVADGPLHTVNFETLVVPGKSPHFWIEDVTLISIPTLDFLTAAKHVEAKTPQHSALLIGDPEKVPGWIPPPEAAKELQLISQRIRGIQPVVLSQKKATPENYRRWTAAKRFTLIHFAAHAEANLENPLESAIILSRPTPFEAFKLYARDVLTHGLDAQLVTLSACHSAGAKPYFGEGLVGFAWAFLQAGARRVAAGLWEVDGDATTQLMKDFYGEMLKGLGPSEALRRAKLEMLKSKNENFRNPFYWGAFQLYVQHAETFGTSHQTPGRGGASPSEKSMPGL